MEEHWGRVNMESMLERKPLHPAERQAPPARVCVTGAAGFIGSRVVARLLACGHSVHATRRAAGDDAAVAAALDALPGAAERLRWFQADLLQEGSFDAAVAGCKYVIHCAGVVSLSVSQRQGFARVVEPTVKGVEHLLQAINQTPSVEKVVLTSSLAAVSSHFSDRGEGHVYSEADWNLDVLRTSQPYFMAKVAAEWHAWALAAQQDRWRLVTICPGNVYGPLMANSPACGPVPSMKKMMDGTVWPFIAPLGLTAIDLDDVAAAHVLAMVMPEAHGRYVLCERSALMTEVAGWLRELYPRHWVPSISLPFWLAVMTSSLLPSDANFPPPALPRSFFWIKVLWNKLAAIDSSKAQRELGLRFIPFKQTLKDFMDSLISHGILPRMPEYSAHPAALPLPTGGAGHATELAGATATVTAKLAEVKEVAAEVAAEAKEAVHGSGGEGVRTRGQLRKLR
ncbi:hypothetical protein ABPG75_010720 [Micractinium tetrahymenae]